MNTKICSKCKIEKSCSLFGVLKRNRDGLRNICKVCRKKEDKKYKEKNPEKTKERQKRFYEKNKEKELLRLKIYRETKPEKRKETKNKWVKKNKEKHNLYSSEWKRNKRIEDPLYKLKENLRSRTKEYMKQFSHTKGKTFDIIGCNPQYLKEYIESKFSDGMSWDNYGFYGWHIDHIIPLSSAKSEKELHKLCHYTNLQPLWSKDNLLKGSKLPTWEEIRN